MQAAPAAQPADTEQAPPVQQEPPLDPPFVVDPAPTTVDTNVVAPVEDPVIKRENLPVIVTLETEESILTPDRTIAVTVTVRAEADLPTDKADLTLTLPKSIATTTGDKNKISWPLPALRANEETVQKLTLQIEKVGNALKREVGALVATVAAPSYPPVETATLLAFAPTPPATEDTQDASGAVIASSDGDVILLAQSAVAPAGVVFRYSELYNWETAGSTSSPTAAIVTPASVTITPDVPLTDTLSLTPLTTVTPTDPLTTDPPVGEPAEPRPTAKIDHNLDAYRLWQLDALQDRQNMHQLTGEVLVQVSVKKLVKAGLDPTSLTLWTREGAEGRWTPVPTVYNEKQQRLQAWLPHFSQFGLGAGLQQSGDMLPSVKAFTVDQLNGGASVSIGIETPKGLGGLSPTLSLSYSSITMDDLFREAGSSEIEAQAGSAGIGWHLGGVSYIARTDTLYDNGVPDTDKKFALVLNGTRVSISFQDGLWRTNPEIFAKIIWPGANSYTGNAQYQAHDYSPWTVWTGDGTKYEFGDAGTFPNAFSSVSPTGTALERTYGNQSFRVTKRWYLRKVTDTLGNTMEYNYQGEQGWETGCVDAGWVSAGQHWYTRAIDPNAIYWSGQGSGYTMRALLSYTSRTDTYVLGDATNDCKQPLYGSNNRLTAVTVQVYSGTSWQTLRSYSLGQGTWGFGGNKNRLYLNNLDQLGKNGTLLQRYNFTYDFYNPNHVLLNAASTNFGGSVTYGYNGVRASCSNSTCPHSMNRYAVTQQISYDGLGNYRAIHHYYGPSTVGDEWSAVGNDGGFMGYKEVQSKYYTANSLSTELRRERLLSYSSGAAADRDNPDPRRGKLLRRELWTQSTGGTLLQATDYDWKAYWLENSAWQTSATSASWKWVGSTVVYPITWIKLEKETTTTGSAVDEKRYTYEGAYGNQIQVQELANNSLQRITSTEYYPNSSAWITNKPATVRGYDSGSTCRAETRTIYDGNGGWYNAAPSQGLVRRIQRALIGCNTYGFVSDTDNNWQVSYFDYDAYGNQTRATDFGNSSSGDVTIYTSYDTAYRLFPIEQWYAASTLHKETATYYGVNGLALSDPKAFWGAIQEHCGVNDVCTRQSYDEFGRRVRRWEAVAKGSGWGSDANANMFWDYYTRGAFGSNTNLILEWRAPRCYGNFVRKQYNGLGELVQEQRPQQNWTTNTDGCNPGNNYPEVDVNYAYDALGRQTQVSVPVASTATWVNRAAVWTNGYTATSYDAIDRPTWVTAPNGEQQQYGYLGRAMSITALGRNGDPNKIVKWQEMDGLGNLNYVRTYNPNGIGGWNQDVQVTLTHDVLGNLRTVNHPNGISNTDITYDVGGRKTSMSDPDLGGWSYAYDRQGKLTRQTDARGKTICLYYDTMARLVGKHFRNDTSCPASPSYDVNYAYDQDHSASNRSRGQLTNVGNSTYGKHLYYNSQGLLAREEVWISGIAQNANTYYGYDSHLRPNTVTYPDGEFVTTNYNAMGQPNRLRSNWYGDLVDGTTGGGGITNGVNYDEAGRLRNMRFPLGNNLWRTNYYFPWKLSPWNGADGNSNGRLWFIGLSYTPDGYDRALLDYRYDSFGNISQHNPNQGTWYNFGYDAQNRLTTGYGVNYSYDSAGRLTNYEGMGYTAYRGHGVTSYSGGQRYYYDNNGNVINRRWGVPANQQTLTWDHENHLSNITGGNGYSENYLYDADGQRVKKSNGLGGVTFYPNSYYETTNETVWVDDAIPGSGALAGGEDGWIWHGGNPVSGTSYHYSPPASGMHQHYFYNATEMVSVGTGDVLYAYVYIDGNVTPQQIMLQWFDGNNWEHRAYWGQNLIGWGVDGTASRRYMGAIPPATGWVRLEVPASLVGLEGVTITGMAFTLAGGHAWWDRAGVRHNSWRGTKYYRFNGQVVAMRKNGVLSYLHGDHLGSTFATSNSSGNFSGQEWYHAYGRYRGGHELGTENRFTGQKLDGAGLMYFNARYYDPELGQFLSPDTLVPDPTNLFAWNRYMYTIGNPLKYNDPTGHAWCMTQAGFITCAGSGISGAVGTALSVGLAAQQGLQVVAPHTDKVIAIADGVVRMSDQAAHHAGQQNASNGGNTGNADPNGLDPNNFDPDKNTNVVRSLQRLFNRYPLDSGNCDKCAAKTYDLFKSAGYNAEVVRFEYGPNVVARRMFAADGTIIATTRGDTRAFHEFVKVGDRVFDAMTGPKGALWDDYLKLWDPHTLELLKGFVVKK